MALLNTGCSISVVQADITGITTGYAAECFAVLAAAVDSATQDRCVTVPTSGSLPSLWPTQTIPQGQVVFVEDVGVPVIAADGKWIGFDQRTLRKDSPTCILYTWGYNTLGPLGDGTTTARCSPGTVAGGGTNWCFISAGGYISAGIKSDGTLWTWGANSSSVGRLGDGTTTNRCSPGTTAGGGTNWCFVSAGRDHTAAIKTDGTLWTWGGNSNGELGDGTTTARSSPATVAGGGNTWCLVSAGNGNTGAIKTDGTVWLWGDNINGQLGNGSSGFANGRSSPVTTAGGGTNWCLVSVGSGFTAAVKTDGTLWTWGANSFGMLATGNTTNRCSPGTTIAGGTDWCSVSAATASSGCHVLAVKTGGTIWSWGFNIAGQLGDGTITGRSSPVTVAGGGSTWCRVSAGRVHSTATKTDGTLWTWGCNTCGRLGDGTTTNRCSPGTVSGGGTDWRSVSAGNFTIGLKGS